MGMTHLRIEQRRS